MRLALVSDIHGNLIALEAVLAELAGEGPDLVVCLGDVAASGPQPREVVERLRTLRWPVVQGNTDSWLADPQPSEPPDETPRLRRLWDISFWCRQQLSPSDLTYLGGFSPTLEVPLVVGESLLAYHGSPRSYDDPLLPTTPEATLDEWFAATTATVLAGGHTHQQMFRRYRNCIVINPGSVGLAIDQAPPATGVRNAAWAEYALVDSDHGRRSVSFRRAPFDVEALLAEGSRRGFPHADWWVGTWRRDGRGTAAREHAVL